MQDNDRHALLIGVSAYDAPHYQDLPAVQADLHYMQAVLERTDIGMFNPCTIAAEPTAAQMMRVVEDFLSERTSTDTALLYFTGHGQYSAADGQLYFITQDSDPDDLSHTAVAAEFLHQQLQECRATARVVLLDCCDSGAAVQSWSAKGTTAGPLKAPAEGVLLRPSGVYVITASRARQSASAKAPEGSTLGTSRFTGEIVEGLRSGRMTDKNWVTTDDLFTYVSQQLRAPGGQQPTRSMLAATGTLRLARGVASPVSLPGHGAQPGDTTPSIPDKALHRAADESRGSARWPQLTDFYLSCMSKEAAADWLPTRSQRDKYEILGRGRELLQSGAGQTMPAPSRLPGTTLGSADSDPEIWYGYPVVTLPATGGARRKGTADSTRLAPLLLQQLELTTDEHGSRILQSAGVPIPHPGVLEEFLETHEITELTSSWQPDWQHGNTAQMLQSIRQLLKILGIDEIQPLDPLLLQGDSVTAEVRPSAHNCALLLTSSGADRATVGLVANLRELADRSSEIENTALADLISDRHRDNRRRRKPVEDLSNSPIVSVQPLNERQEEIIRAVLGNGLTVATGPAGTGKSQLVTALVETAAHLGWKTAVASTNNKAVDEVEGRCSAIAPGLLLRTGNPDVRVREAENLARLLQDAEPPECSPGTASGELRIARDALAAARTRLAGVTEHEAALVATATERNRRLTDAGAEHPTLSSVWAGQDDQLRRWAHRARKAADARLLGPWRRRRTSAALLKALDAAGTTAPTLAARATDPATVSATLAALADAGQAEWKLRQDLLLLPPDAAAQAMAALTRAGEQASLASGRLIRSTTNGRVRAARTLIQARLSAFQRGRDLRRTQRDLMSVLGSWAVTTHSVQQLDLAPGHFDLVIIDEASQCSIPAVMPLLFRAKRALIIGDPAQLGHISSLTVGTERDARRHAQLSASWLEERRLGYTTASAFDAAAHAFGEPIFLDEHYRCHPDIAEIPNRACYAGRLRVLTDVRKLERPGAGHSATPLRWIDVSNSQPLPGPQGSWYNSSEVRQVQEIVSDLTAALPPHATIGVITPFREQRKRLQAQLDGTRVAIGTVHRFQGGECDVIVLSLAANATMPRRTVNWLSREAQLWNVAITRAKAQLITVGDHAFWSGQPGLPATLAQQSAEDGPFVLPALTTRVDQLSDMLHAHLIKAGHTRVQRDVRPDGHQCDFLVTTNEGDIALLIDRGPEVDEDAARHLRLLHAQAALLPGLLPSTPGGSCDPIIRTVRIPAWKILAAEHAGDLLGD
ncbi:AAA domain-containing protein [Kitasatospora sp. NPDC050543]|uniref:caspase, EACC1-associated type n=1 Tax=Kitasatospora sp. NPDC050543 TaxID=3364054 RepID=UPI0037A73036